MCVDTRTSSTQCSALDRKWICSGCQKEPHSSQPWNTPPKKRTTSWNCYEGAPLQRPFVLRKGQKMITHTSAGGSCMEFRVIQDLSDLSEHMQFWIRRNGKCMRSCTSTYFTAKHCVFIAEEKGDDSPLCLEQGASPEAASFRSNQLGCTGQESQASQASLEQQVKLVSQAETGGMQNCFTEKPNSKWVCLKIVYPYTQWLMIIIPTKWL